MRLRIPSPMVFTWFVAAWGPVAGAEVLFYGGGSIGEQALENLKHDAITSAVYDDFLVADDGWKIEALQAHIGAFENASPSAAEWEIRRGVSEGDGGILVAAGTTTDFTWTSTGVTGPALFEHILRVDVSDQNVVLAPGIYHMMLRPHMSLSELMALLYKTDGVGGVGQPRGNGNSFLNSPGYNYIFRSIESLSSQTPSADFRYTIEGTRIRKSRPDETPPPKGTEPENQQPKEAAGQEAKQSAGHGVEQGTEHAADQEATPEHDWHAFLTVVLRCLLYLLF